MENFTEENLKKFNFMKKLEFFKMLNKNALWPLASIATLRNYSPDEILIAEGSDPVGIFILEKGTVQVFKTMKDGSEFNVTELGAGQIIGEIAVIDKLKTTASVRAIEPIECIFISEWDFNTQIHSYPEIALQLLPVLASRIRIMYGKLI